MVNERVRLRMVCKERARVKESINNHPLSLAPPIPPLALSLSQSSFLSDPHPSSVLSSLSSPSTPCVNKNSYKIEYFRLLYRQVKLKRSEMLDEIFIN